ncbi:MAG: hypothetical protein KC593_11960 [Myxococcales bacterium]|nr:hypothetical protein [Myxococcales bacterium]MCB9629459.1 hypothetical protein [Sandaracinaceae bacterium]
MAVGDDEREAENAYYVYTLQRLGRALPGARVTFLLDYLQRHPAGAHNRHVAERLERALDALPDTPLRAGLTHRYRALRDPLLPPLSQGERG